MYLALARDFLFAGKWTATTDPYLYSLQNAPLVWQHEYLSYLYYAGFYEWLGAPGLILAKSLLLTALFVVVLHASPRARNHSLLWISLWTLAVLAGSFRFIERSSVFSDLFCVLLAWWLSERERLRRRDTVLLSLLFCLWIQLHPGFPLGLSLLGLWWLHRKFLTQTVDWRATAWLLLPMTALLINPMGLDGVLYPFRFALAEAVTLKQSNFEWFPSYHQAFRYAPEVIAFWVLCLAALAIIGKNKLYTDLRAWMSLFALASAVQAVRFIPWACFCMLVLLKPWALFQHRRLLHPKWVWAIAAILTVIAVKNLSLGYHSSSGKRLARLGFDPKFFPFKTLQVLRAQPIPGRVYNTHDFGSFLIWQGYTPLFHHGFVTDMNFYSQDVMGVFQSQERFLELARKYGWTMLLVEKYGAYKYFHKILSPLTDWKIVAEDEASYLIYLLPDTPSQGL